MKKIMEKNPEQEQKLIDFVKEVSEKLGSVNKFVRFHSGFGVITMTDGSKYSIKIDRYISPEITIN